MNEEHGLRRGLTNYGDRDFAAYLRRSFAHSMGLSREMLEKPIIGIAMTPSGFNNCHRMMPDLVEAVSRGVLAAGALPRPFPTTSLGEVFLSLTSAACSGEIRKDETAVQEVLVNDHIFLGMKATVG